MDNELVGGTIYLANTMCGMMTNLHVMCQAYTLWRWQCFKFAANTII